MGVTPQQIKELRERTGISVMQCKKALEEAGGDMEKALVILRKKGSETAAKKSDRALGAGAIGAYVHTNNDVAALVQLSSETDFVANNEEFVTLARNIAMHVTAVAPQYISRDEVSEADMEQAKSVLAEEIKDKPEEMHEKILSGKLDAYFKDQVLLEQPYIKDQDKTIADLINEAIQKFGENIVIRRISRLSVK